MNGDYTERLSQESECRDEGNSCLLESASAVANRILEEIKALAGTTACKSIQLVRLRKSSLTPLSILPTQAATTPIVVCHPTIRSHFSRRDRRLSQTQAPVPVAIRRK